MACSTACCAGEAWSLTETALKLTALEVSRGDRKARRGSTNDDDEKKQKTSWVSNVEGTPDRSCTRTHRMMGTRGWVAFSLRGFCVFSPDSPSPSFLSFPFPLSLFPFPNLFYSPFPADLAFKEKMEFFATSPYSPFVLPSPPYVAMQTRTEGNPPLWLRNT